MQEEMDVQAVLKKIAPREHGGYTRERATMVLQ